MTTRSWPCRVRAASSNALFFSCCSHKIDRGAAGSEHSRHNKICPHATQCGTIRAHGEALGAEYGGGGFVRLADDDRGSSAGRCDAASSRARRAARARRRNSARRARATSTAGAGLGDRGACATPARRARRETVCVQVGPLPALRVERARVEDVGVSAVRTRAGGRPCT